MDLTEIKLENLKKRPFIYIAFEEEERDGGDDVAVAYSAQQPSGLADDYLQLFNENRF